MAVPIYLEGNLKKVKAINWVRLRIYTSILEWTIGNGYFTVG